MNVSEFKTKLDNRELSLINSAGVWEAAEEWLAENNHPDSACKWSWDCGFKLDYDGVMCEISSRFYPPHKNSAEHGKYHGSIEVLFKGKCLRSIEVESETLDDLKVKVEECVSKIADIIELSIKNALKELKPNGSIS